MAETSGVRFELRLRDEGAGGARYDIELELSDGRHRGAATIAPEAGQIAFDWQSAPPSWCENTVRAQLRTLYRERSSGYPRRVTRWRPAPEGAAG